MYCLVHDLVSLYAVKIDLPLLNFRHLSILNTNVLTVSERKLLLALDTFIVLSRYLSCSLWIRNLLLDGDVEANPGPPRRLPLPPRPPMSRRMAKRVSRNQSASQCPSQAQLDGQLLIREHIKQRVDGRRRVSIQHRQPQLMRLAGDNFQEHFRPVIDSFDAEPPDPIVILKNQRVLIPPIRLPILLSIDIESWNMHDPLATSRTNLRTRNQERESLFKQAEDDYGDIIDSDAQAERDIQNSLIAGDNLVTFSKILCISGHFGYLDERDFYHIRSFLFATRECAVPSRNPDLHWNVVPQWFDDEASLLTSFFNLLGEYEPTYICGHNVNEFDWPLITTRSNDLGVQLPVRSVVYPNYRQYLIARWMKVREVVSNYVFVDTLQFAKKFIKSRYGFSLANLSHKLLNERKPRLHPDLRYLLPIDIANMRGQIGKLLLMNSWDSFTTLRLFLLFRRQRFILPSFVTIKTTVASFFKHMDLIDQVDDQATKTDSLRELTSYCLKLFFLALYEQNYFNWPKIDDQFVTSLMAQIKDICARHHNVRFNQPSASINATLREFLDGDDNLIRDPDLGTIGFEEILGSVASYLPHLPAFGSSRPPEYMAPVIVANLEVNLQERYFQYLERFINVKFEQQWFESKQIKRTFRTTEEPMATAAFRMRLRQIKNLFLDGSRVDLTAFATSQDYHDWNESIIVSIMSKFNVSRNEATRTISIINEYNVPLLTEFLDDDDLLNLLYPLECANGLKQKLHDDPQSFLKASIFISRYLELHESKPFHVIPLSKGNVPSFFPIDTRTLWSIIKNNVLNQHQVETLQNQNLFDLQSTVVRYTPQQQNDFWSIFTNIGTGKLRKPGYTFNNIIHTDGFSVSVEFVRNDLVGLGHGKPDSTSLGESDIYITDIEREDLVNRTIVTCDPGKRDMLYFASRKPIPLANNIRSFRHGFNSHRLTMCEWTRVSRTHEKQMRQAKRVNLSQDPLTQVTWTIEEWESELSEHRSNSCFFVLFLEFVVAKIRINFLTRAFYTARLWRIQKMQRFVHSQKCESFLLKSLISKFGNRDEIVVAMGDQCGGGKKNLRHQRPTRGYRWNSFLKRNGFEVYLVDETLTSKRCPLCQNEVKNFLEVQNPRVYKRIKSPIKTCWGLLGCESDVCKADVRPVGPVEVDPNRPRHYYLRRFWNRNRLACLNMLNIVDSVVNGQERPLYLSN
ncbi:hypothetical protein RCL1_000153 [Eukaryota sp. TZLM3-RCL]